eukprot:1311695-Alexandrium_andersonii.AAC.1
MGFPPLAAALHAVDPLGMATSGDRVSLPLGEWVPRPWQHGLGPAGQRASVQSGACVQRVVGVVGALSRVSQS